MFKFEHIEFFYGFAVIPIVFLIFGAYLVQRRKKLKLLGDENLVKELSPYSNLRKRVTKLLLFVFALSSLILALCNLQTGSKLTEVKREGAELIVCLDVSNSMLAQDLSPNRLTRAKYALEKMIDQLQGDRLGLVIFAGEAYVQLPITSDYNAAKMFLESIGPGMVPVQGTDLAQAISKASESFSKEEGRNKAIILISDGESHEADAVEGAAEAAKAGIMINCIGIGTENGVPIPLIQNGVIKGYRKDKDGNPIITKLNSSILKDISAKANGVYVQASQADLGLDAILDKVDELDKAQVESKMYTDFEDQFQWFLALTLFFLLIDFFVSERTSEWYKKLNLFGRGAMSRSAFLVSAFSMLSLVSNAQQDGKKIYEGNNQYFSGRIPEASSTYAKALELNPANRKANFNLGNALYKNALMVKNGELAIPPNVNMTSDSLSKLIFDQAAQNFAVVANSVSNKDTLHRAWHNIGNCYLQKKDYQEAVNAYKKALKFDPKDEETRYNLAYALKHLPKDKKGGGGKNQQNKQQEDKKDPNKNATPQKNNMDKQQAEQILKALMNSEKKLQDKRKQQDTENSKKEKDW